MLNLSCMKSGPQSGTQFSPLTYAYATASQQIITQMTFLHHMHQAGLGEELCSHPSPPFYNPQPAISRNLRPNFVLITVPKCSHPHHNRAPQSPSRQ